MSQVLAALTTAVVGFVVSVGGVVADVATGSEIGPWAQVGGTATAVAALAYVAKLLADGRLVAQPVADLLRASAVREERLSELLDDAHGREDALRAFLFRKSTT